MAKIALITGVTGHGAFEEMLTASPALSPQLTTCLVEAR